VEYTLRWKKMDPNVVRNALIQGGLEASLLSLKQNSKPYLLRGNYQGNDFSLEFSAGQEESSTEKEESVTKQDLYESLKLSSQKKDLELETALTILMDYFPFVEYEENGLKVTEWEKHPRLRYRVLLKVWGARKIRELRFKRYYEQVIRKNGR
jgi:hypothetical protein